MEIHPLKIYFTQDRLIESRLNNRLKLNIFRIIQEQLNNILKYAKASVINIGVSQNKKSTILYISDNGIGFNLTKKTEGIGIKNIRNRAKIYKGNANFTTEPGKGCVLTVAFPLFTSTGVQAVLL
jgi:signal transduction histidine kinase